MAVYELNSTPANPGNNTLGETSMKVTERHIYGSSRLGMDVQSVELIDQQGPLLDTSQFRILGLKQYEISNHLGNVLSVISDVKLAVTFTDQNNLVSIVGYKAMVISVTDYSPFGVGLYDRSWSAPEYRYGFNGKEKDDEFSGEGNSYDFGARIYDGRLGKFLSCDPLFHTYHYQSNYCYAGNSPITLIDIDGKGAWPSLKTFLSNDSYYATGLIFGIGDGILESIELATDIVKFSQAWSPSTIFFWTDEGSSIRSETIDFTYSVINLVSDAELADKVYNSIKTQLGDWFSDVTFESTTGEAGYAHGKMVFDVLLGCIGVSEIKYLLRKGSFSVSALRKIAADRLRKIYKSFDDTTKNSNLIKDKLDKKQNKRYIEREYIGEGTAQEHFDNLAEANGIKPHEGLQNFTGKDGANYEIHESTGGDGRMAITKKYTNEKSEQVEEKVRFEIPTK